MTDDIPLALIDPPADPVRKRIDPARQQALEDSVREFGVLTPILVTREDNRYRVIAGSRRLAAARAADLPTIPAYVRALDEAERTGAALVENAVREQMTLADQWRAFRRMREQGIAMHRAQNALGLTPREALRLERLAKLPAAVLDLVDAWGPPGVRVATVMMQAGETKLEKAAKRYLKTSPEHESWHSIAAEIETRRANRADAIFDIEKSKLAWDEDLWAQPDDPRRFTTNEFDRFIKLQTAAIDDEITRRAPKENVARAERDKWNTIADPKGFTQTYGAEARMKRGYAERIMLKPDGRVERYYFKPKPAPAKSSAAAKEAAAPGEGQPTAEETQKRGISRAGLAMIAKAKTNALRQRLAQRALPWEDLAKLVIFAFAANNVAVRGGFYAEGMRQHQRFDALAARLLTPGGTVAPLTDDLAHELLHELLATIFEFTGPDATTYAPGSGEAAEWAGTLVNAAELLPRFDTAEFLAHVPADELRQAAEAAGLTPKKTATAKALRELLADKARDWRPDAAHFGAPGPIIADPDNDDVGEGDPDGEDEGEE
ncbi:MAG: ParB/RepB/Spo0J family partition protein [Xanthomonadaceae bacterium]|nr:ParB/RepB/Spo0J family partition protein [Xanthomonadaceae bacterium]